MYNQELNPEFLSGNTLLANEKSTHYLLNYNYKTDKNIIRLEGYYKNYTDLVNYETSENGEKYNVANDGEGRAYGIDMF